MGLPEQLDLLASQQKVAMAAMATAGLTLAAIQKSVTPQPEPPPPSPTTGPVDLGPLINALKIGEKLDVKAMRDAGQGPFYSQAGVAKLTAGNAQVFGDPDNPIPWEVRPGPGGQGGSGVNILADGVQIGGFQPFGDYLWCSVGSDKVTSRAWDVRDLLTPACPTDGTGKPGLNTLIKINPGCEHGKVADVGRPDRLAVCKGAVIFNMASDVTFTDVYAASQNEHAARCDAQGDKSAPPVNLVFNGGEYHRYAGNAKESLTIRVGQAVFNGSKFPGYPRLAQEVGGDVKPGDIVKADFNDCIFSDVNPTGSQLDIKGGAFVNINQGCRFDQTKCPVASTGATTQQAVSGNGNSVCNVAGTDVAVVLPQGVKSKAFVSGAQRTGNEVLVIHV